MVKSDDERRALALERTGQDRLVFKDNDVVDLLRIAIEREGGQSVTTYTLRSPTSSAIAALTALLPVKIVFN